MKIIASMAACANNTERQLMRDFFESILNYYLNKENVKDQRELEKKCGKSIYLNYESDIEPCDVAIQFGVAKDRANDHHIARSKIKQNARNIIYLETPLLGRTISRGNNYPSYRVGVNGFLNNQGIFYLDNKIDKSRLEKLREISHFPKFPGWKDHKKGDILILVQLPGDASMRNQRVSEWLTDTIDEIRSFTQRRITIRLHPALSGKGRSEFFAEIGDLICKNYSDLFWSDGSRKLDQDLARAGVSLSYSSGSSIDSILLGVPTIAIDEGNLAYPISSRKILDINSPKLASVNEIEDWLNKIANSQWTTEEINNGVLWEHLRYVLSTQGVPGV